MSKADENREACRDYVFAMLRELAVLLLNCGDVITAEELMIIVHNAPDFGEAQTDVAGNVAR